MFNSRGFEYSAWRMMAMADTHNDFGSLINELMTILPSPETEDGRFNEAAFGNVTKSLTNTARRATSLLIPKTQGYSSETARKALELLSTTAFYEPKLDEDIRRSKGGRVAALFNQYGVPAIVTADPEDNAVNINADFDVARLMGLDAPHPIGLDDECVVIVYGTLPQDGLPKKIDRFTTSTSKPLNKSVILPEGRTPLINVDGYTSTL
jgi:hypothetical protein